LSAVQLGWRVVVKLQIANEHTSQKPNENFHSAQPWHSDFLRLRDSITPDCH
jgi:hypothetical protein